MEAAWCETGLIEEAKRRLSVASDNIAGFCVVRCGSMLSKKYQTASRLISRRKTNHAMIVRRYAPRLVTKVTGEFIALRCLPPHIYKIAAPTARRICVQRCKKTFSTASTQGRYTKSFRAIGTSVPCRASTSGRAQSYPPGTMDRPPVFARAKRCATHIEPPKSKR